MFILQINKLRGGGRGCRNLMAGICTEANATDGALPRMGVAGRLGRAGVASEASGASERNIYKVHNIGVLYMCYWCFSGVFLV